jgi:hypothetical protein
MAAPPGPVPLARLGVELTVRALPTWEDRLRYRAEFLAELDDLSPAEQLRYAVGVLSQTFALRAALGAPTAGSEEDAMEQRSNFWRVFRCRVLRWHDYRRYSNSDGERYSACSVCDREANASGYNTIGI